MFVHGSNRIVVDPGEDITYLYKADSSHISY